MEALNDALKGHGKFSFGMKDRTKTGEAFGFKLFIGFVTKVLPKA